MQRIGFVGLGAMGAPMARNLLAKGFAVRGFDTRAVAMDDVVAAGGERAADAAAVAESADVLVLMVVNAAQAAAVLFDGGALERLPEGASVVLMATCPPGTVAALAERVEAAGRRFVDAPVSGGVVGARAGTLTIMAACPRAVFDAVRPVLAAMGDKVFHVGERAGQGATVKTVNQLLCGVHIAVAAEGLAFAERQGIDPALALKLLGTGAAGSWMLANRGPRMVSDDPTVASSVDIFVKDLGLVLDAGRATKMGLPLAAAAHQLFLDASGLGLGGKDDSQVIATYRALAPKAK